MRLNQFLAYHTGMSRRDADESIKKGLTEVNGDIGELFNQISPADTVRIYKNGEWKTIGQNTVHKTILIYKPIFTITSRKDVIGRKTIYDILPKSYSSLKPAGRLDYMSEGILVLSNNGDLIYKLSHPKNESEKIYLVGLKYILKSSDIKEISHGLVIDGYKLNPVQVELFKEPNDNKGKNEFEYLSLQSNFFWYSFTLTEGRNNEIRNICENYGQKVLRLIRVQQGQFKLTKELFEKKLIEVN